MLKFLVPGTTKKFKVSRHTRLFQTQLKIKYIHTIKYAYNFSGYSPFTINGKTATAVHEKLNTFAESLEKNIHYKSGR